MRGFKYGQWGSKCKNLTSKVNAGCVNVNFQIDVFIIMAFSLREEVEVFEARKKKVVAA